MPDDPLRGYPPQRLILASGSPARRELLARHGYQFTVQPAHVTLWLRSQESR